MLMAGDEMGRTQRGNNNAYCQDNEISWVNWNLDPAQRALLDFTCRLVRLRKKEGVLREDYFFRGDRISDSRLKDLAFFRPDGGEMPPEDWQAPFVRSLAYLLGGDALVVPDKAGRRPMGNTLIILLNAHHEDVRFTLPHVDWGAQWELVVDTSVPGAPSAAKFANGASLQLPARSMMVLRRTPPSPDEI
jgi:glycogen operon protein